MKNKKGIILCVDDERVVLNSLQDLLRIKYGNEHLVEIAESAEEGLEVLEELQEDGYTPLVIISDWLMPGMKGDEFLVQAREMFPHTLNIMLSGQADQEAITKARENNSLDKFIAKPWDMNELLNDIDTGLKQTPS